MLHALALILATQLAGEALTRSLSLPVPGPVLGMVALTIAFAALPRLREAVRPVAQGILGHLSLLFVPAGVGVIGHLQALSGMGVAIALAIVCSTALAIGAGALTFALVARLTGATDD
jgi:holin-like protein